MQKRIRVVKSYGSHFEVFLKAQTKDVQRKIFKVIESIETLEHVPSKFLKSIKGTRGLFEARIRLGSNIWRVFCFFDEDALVILLNGFQKKDQKTPQKEINKALRLMQSYYHEKEQ